MLRHGRLGFTRAKKSTCILSPPGAYPCDISSPSMHISFQTHHRIAFTQYTAHLLLPDLQTLHCPLHAYLPSFLCLPEGSGGFACCIGKLLLMFASKGLSAHLLRLPLTRFCFSFSAIRFDLAQESGSRETHS